jgi:hypothetical protein
MAKTSFGREPREDTTEPMADEATMKRGGRVMHKATGGAAHKAEMKEMHKIEKELKHHEGMKAGAAHHGLKHGGKVHHKAVGGVMPGAIPAAIARRAAPIAMRRAMPAAPAAGTMMKHGGKAHHKAEGGAIGAAEREMPHGTPKALAGLKMPTQRGKEINDADSSHRMGREGKAHGKAAGTTGGVEGPGYKHGGKIVHKADGGAIKGVRGSEPRPTKVVIDRMVQNRKHGGTIHHKAAGGNIAPYENSPHEAKQTKSFSTKTGGVEGSGYKRGGKVLHKAEGGSITKFESKMNGFTSHKGSSKTGEIKESPAGYKKGGHVMHKSHGGHTEHHSEAKKHHDDHGHKHMHAAGHHESHGHIHHKMHEHKGGAVKKAHGGGMRTSKNCNY